MKSFKTLFMGVVVAGLVVSAGLVGTAKAQNPPPTKLAVVNIVRVFDSLNERVNSDSEIEAMGKDINEQMRKMQEELETLSKQFEHPPFKEGTPEFKQMQDDLLDKSMKMQVYRGVSEQKLVMEKRVRTVAIYNSMNAAIEQYCKANGIGLVFVTDDADFGGAKTVQEVLSRITVRKVIYAAPEYDITQRIIEKMNSDYRLNTKH